MSDFLDKGTDDIAKVLQWKSPDPSGAVRQGCVSVCVCVCVCVCVPSFIPRAHMQTGWNGITTSAKNSNMYAQLQVGKPMRSCTAFA